MSTFKIWNQANNGTTMGIRASDVTVVSQLGAAFNRPSDDGLYLLLDDYLTQLAVATTPPPPYRRSVDVLWRTAIGYSTQDFLRIAFAK